ncbi:hypothetical protein JMJ55_25155 [Belnapia sp. T6]|uniref:Uncharacterized protein n=1 Tax=Belnapia mucosa TaxID=2804532 RepID=A0ABS1VBE3_9PROT|nr:hypothetical protein [Belnapia mucosa]MBL6458632.1 hypothetical protein [Belnapia mucosa]
MVAETPFAPGIGPFVFTRAERAEAAAFCAALGTDWGAEAVVADDGAVGPGADYPGQRRLPAWQLTWTVAGIALFSSATFETVGVFPSLRMALAAVAKLECGAVEANDNATFAWD